MKELEEKEDEKTHTHTDKKRCHAKTNLEL